MPFRLLTVKGNFVPESDDVTSAFKLLWGVNRFYTTADDQRRASLDGLKKTKFPSGTTKPTEKEAMAALARVLATDDPPKVLLKAVAALFDPGNHPFGGNRRVVFKKAGKGHNDSGRKWSIANLMFDLCQHMNYDEAAEEVTRLTGVGDRQVKRIYGALKESIEYSNNALKKTLMTPDAPSVDMTSNKRT